MGLAERPHAKTNIAPLDDAAVLDKVARSDQPLELQSEHGVRHVGPMAQDFYAAFGVGEDDRHITSIDEDGVALAAIKALHAENAALRVQQNQLLARDAAMQREVRAKQRQFRTNQVHMQREIDQLGTLLRIVARRQPSAAH